MVRKGKFVTKHWCLVHDLVGIILVILVGNGWKCRKMIFGDWVLFVSGLVSLDMVVKVVRLGEKG